ncbi:MAG TPA: secretin N-terminal domain-containing protein, partial [Elusimicrobiota bacterium]|nr:secretin N-terminal domain-containing protein [Elusimicrobiota bacterium]
MAPPSPLKAQANTKLPPATPPPGAVAAPSADSSNDVTVKDSSAPPATKTAGQNTLSVDFPEDEIRNILRNIAELYDLNIVIPDTLQGKTSIKLHDVNWRQIFSVVLSPVGYTYIEDGNIIKIVSNESLAQEPLTTEIFVINYAKASDIQPTLVSLVDASAGGKIVVDARTNSLVITERPTRMRRIRPVIEQLDRPTAQVM